MADTTNEIYIGDGLAFSLTALDANGDPFNLTGYSVYGGMKSSPSDTDFALDFSSTIPTPSNGVISVNVATETVTAGQYGWDVIIQNGSNEPVTVFTGILKFKRRNTPNP